MLGSIIKKFIDKKGFNQSQIARIAGLTTQAFNDFLNGRRKLETTEYFKVCAALGVSANYFQKKLEQEENIKVS